MSRYFVWKSPYKILDLTYLKLLDMKDLNDYKLENLEDEILTQGRIEALLAQILTWRKEKDA